MASPAVEYAASPLAGRLRPQRFVIVCGPRTGSELLRELLDSLTEVRCEGELLKKPTRWPVAFLNGRAALGGQGRRAWGCKIIGANLLEAQAESRPPGDGVLAELVAEGWKIVHLHREDLLAQALSFIHAMQGGTWHFRDPQSTFERFAADPAEVIAILYILDGKARWLDERLLHLPHTRLSYEGDLVDPGRRMVTLANLADVLGVTDTGASSDLRAVAPARPEDRISNLPEVLRALEQTRFAWLCRSPAEGDLA